jgi:hypothetical protein
LAKIVALGVSSRNPGRGGSRRWILFGEVIGSGPPLADPQAKVELCLPGRDPCCAAAFSVSGPASSCVDPRCSISGDPRREDDTTCTAVAPDEVFSPAIRRHRPDSNRGATQVEPGSWLSTAEIPREKVSPGGLSAGSQRVVVRFTAAEFVKVNPVPGDRARSLAGSTHVRWHRN